MKRSLPSLLVAMSLVPALACGIVPQKWGISPGQTELLGGEQEKGAIAREVYVVMVPTGEDVLEIDVQRGADDAKREGAPGLIYSPALPHKIRIQEARDDVHSRIPQHYGLVVRQLVNEQGLIGPSAPEGSELSLAFCVAPGTPYVGQSIMNAFGMFLWGVTGSSTLIVSAVLRQPGEREIVASSQHVDYRFSSGLVALGNPFDPPFELVDPDGLPAIEHADHLWFGAKIEYLLARRVLRELRARANLPPTAPVDPSIRVVPYDPVEALFGPE